VSDPKPSFAFSAKLRGGRCRLFIAIGVTVAITGIILAPAQTPPPLRRSQIRRTLPITRFYDTPDPLPEGKPGVLIRSEEFDQYEIPYSITAIRILYHSRSASGRDVAVSGVVLFPYDKKPPAGGWPVIAWGHGSTGIARTCAPSLMRNIGYSPFLSMYVNLGYAVVATDYAGLGTPFRNAFLDGPSNAADVINSIPAARAAVSQLGTRWVVMGKAEGGLTTVAVAERENEIRDPGYLGAIAIADLASVGKMYADSTRVFSSLMLTSLAYGLKTLYPQFQETDMLTPKGLALYHEIEQDCSEARTAPELAPDEVVKPGWKSNAFVRQYFDRNDPGQTQAYGPILVISGAAPAADLTTATAQTIHRMCKQGDHIQWEQYPDRDPGDVIGDSVRDQIGWIEGRFRGRPAPANCPQLFSKPLLPLHFSEKHL
jgi:hypothetical protein